VVVPESLELALSYRDRRLCVIPIAAGTKNPPPGVRWKQYQTARPTESTLRRWFGNGKAHGIAIVLGEVSGGLVCRDFDSLAAYESWAAEYPELAKTLPTVATGRGCHVYCRADMQQVRAASPSGGGIINLGDGELRGTGGYCVLPPSRHPSGHIYHWIVPLNGEIPLLDLHDCGFLKEGHATESTETTERTETTEDNRGQQKSLGVEGVVAGKDPALDQSPGVSGTIEQAIQESLPYGVGRRNRQVFQLARHLKSIPALADANPLDLEPFVREWHRRALPFIGTKPFEETWIDFLRGWPRVKFPKGSEPMALIFAKALEADVPKVAERYDRPELRLLVSLCRELQRAAGDGPFYLAVRTAGRLLGVDHTTAWRWLWLLEQEGILKVVIRGDQSGTATRFRYVA
jgi:hypothetical protein